MTIPVRVLLLLMPGLLIVARSTAADEEAPQALAWHHEGFAAISTAANEAKAEGKRLLLGLSGGST